MISCPCQFCDKWYLSLITKFEVNDKWWLNISLIYVISDTYHLSYHLSYHTYHVMWMHCSMPFFISTFLKSSYATSQILIIFATLSGAVSVLFKPFSWIIGPKSSTPIVSQGMASPDPTPRCYPPDEWPTQNRKTRTRKSERSLVRSNGWWPPVWSRIQGLQTCNPDPVRACAGAHGESYTTPGILWFCVVSHSV